MASILDMDKFGDKAMFSSRTKLFLYVTSYGADVTVRFVGKPESIYQYFAKDPNDPDRRTSFYKMIDDGDSGHHRVLRVASLVIDRSDDKIRAFISPISVWQQTENHLKHDFRIKREGHGLNTKYIVNRLEPSEVTEEQQKMIEATQDAFSFEHIYIKKQNWEILTIKQEVIESRFDIIDL